MYVKILPTQNILNITPAEEEPEHVVLGKIITNLPETGEGWDAEYSEDEYVTLAKQTDIPPENEVDLVSSQYMYDFVNHYWGAIRPASCITSPAIEKTHLD